MIKFNDKVAQRILALAVGLSLILFTSSLLLSTIDVLTTSTAINQESTAWVLLGTDDDYAYYSYIDAIGQIQYSKIEVDKFHSRKKNNDASVFSGHLNGWND
ncbi:MAG: hypothetical protein GY810_18155 [Aureispira sp.]|nr:hypothetical protein [Aureispira sp.]